MHPYLVHGFLAHTSLPRKPARLPFDRLCRVHDVPNMQTDRQTDPDICSNESHLCHACVWSLAAIEYLGCARWTYALYSDCRLVCVCFIGTARIYVTVCNCRVSVRLSVRSIIRPPLRRVCCCGHGGQEILVDCSSRATARLAAANVRAVPCCQLT